jgi:hypothetical protein
MTVLIIAESIIKPKLKGSMITRSEKQSEALINRRNKGLNSIFAKQIGFSCQGVVGQFIELYLQCDVFATKIQHFYQTDNGLKKRSLNTVSLTKALEHFNLHFDISFVKKLFQGGTGKRGCKSAKQLRNGYLHELSEADENEIISNNDEFISVMKKFIKLRLSKKARTLCEPHE